MQFKLQLKIGIDTKVPGVGISHKVFKFDVEASSLAEAMDKAKQVYFNKFGNEPTTFPTFQLVLAMDNTGAAAPGQDTATTPAPAPAPAAEPAPAPAPAAEYAPVAPQVDEFGNPLQ